MRLKVQFNKDQTDHMKSVFDFRDSVVHELYKISIADTDNIAISNLVYKYKSSRTYNENTLISRTRMGDFIAHKIIGTYVETNGDTTTLANYCKGMKLCDLYFRSSIDRVNSYLYISDLDRFGEVDVKGNLSDRKDFAYLIVSNMNATKTPVAVDIKFFEYKQRLPFDFTMNNIYA